MLYEAANWVHVETMTEYRFLLLVLYLFFQFDWTRASISIFLDAEMQTLFWPLVQR